MRSRPMRLAAYKALSAAVMRLWLVARLGVSAATPMERVMPGRVLPRSMRTRLFVQMEMVVRRSQAALISQSGRRKRNSSPP